MKVDLSEIKKRFRPRAAVAITLESGRLAVSLVRADEDSPQPVQSFSLPLGAEEVLKDPKKAGQQLAAALGAAGIRERRCVVCVPPGWVLTTSTDLPDVGAGDLRGYLELCAEREFAIPGADLRLGYCAYSLPTGQQRERLLKAMEKAGWVQAKAARLLNLTPRQVGYALKKYNIEVKRI